MVSQDLIGHNDDKTEEEQLTLFRSLLKFYHELGMIFYWGSEVCPVTDEDHLLLNTIVIDMQSFTDLLSAVLEVSK